MFERERCEVGVEESRAPKPSDILDYRCFDSAAYLAEYYGEIGTENEFLLSFYHRVYRQIPPPGCLLEFGGGPTIYQLISAAMHARSIVFADYLQPNREAVDRWLRGDPRAHNWDPYLDYVIRLQGVEPSDEMRERLRRSLREGITEIIECDANLPQILGPSARNRFDVVSSSFCLECITNDEKKFHGYMAKIHSLLTERGSLVLTMLKGATYYRIGSSLFPALEIDERYMERLLERLGYDILHLDATPAEGEHGYAGLMGIAARRRT